MIKRIIRISDRKRILNFFRARQNCKLDYCFKIQSHKTGPSVLIIASTHGNEIVGGNFTIRFVKKLEKRKIKLLRGNIYFLLANPEALKKDKRFVDYNLNRAFTDKKDLNKYEFRRAQEIERFFKNKKIDFVIDLHSVSADNSQMLVLRNDFINKLKNIMHKSKLPFAFIYNKGDIPGTVMDIFYNKNIKAVTIECGNHFKRSSMKIAEHEVFNILSSLNMLHIDTHDTEHKMKAFEVIEHIPADEDFKWKVEAKTGVKISKGQVFAESKNLGKIKASADSVLFMPSAKVDKNDTDAGFLCKETYI